MRPNQVACARAIETTAEGKAPHAVRLWRAGINETDKGPVNFTAKSAELVMKAYEKRGNPLVFDYEHETLLPLEVRGGSPMKGAASADRANLEVRPDESGEPELWATNIRWTDEAARQIEARERGQISPVSNFNKKTREVTEIINVALCIEGATFGGSLLASAAKGKVLVMDELIQKICDAAAAMDWATVEALAEQAETMDGGAAAAKMGKAMAAGGKAMAPPPPPPAPKSAPAPMAVSRVVVPAGLDIAQQEAFSRLMAESRAATLESKRATVGMMIATSRDCFDAVDEKEHIASADPASTQKHIASVRRKVESGTIAASRAAAKETDAKEPKKDKPEDGSFGLDAIEIQAATRGNIPLKDYAAAKARNAAGKGN